MGATNTWATKAGIVHLASSGKDSGGQGWPKDDDEHLQL